MSSLITDAVTSAQGFLEQISYPIPLEQVLTNVISLYPGDLKEFKIIRKENGKEIVNFPFNPTVNPMSFMIQKALSSATSQNNMGIQVNNVFAMILMDNIYKNQGVISGEAGIPLTELLQKDCICIEKQDTGTSLLLADAQGNVNGDVLKIIVDF